MPVDGAVLQNRYRILRTLSDKGGMGVVYQAEDQRLGSTVVVKETRYLQMKPEVRDLVLKAFFREAHLLANLQHPALPRVTDYFVEGDGHFLVMEFIRGKDLEEMLTERGAAFPVEDVLRWADRLLEALEYLHGHDEPVIHRDIKPANLKLTPRDEIMLLDFGLAKGAAVGLQAASSVFGYTKQYAPLEQIQGKGTDARSDLFSLAATFYHFLTGVVPPDAVERVSEVVMGNPDPLKPVADLNRIVPMNISAVLSRAMALKLDDRPATAAVMRQALRVVKPTPQPTPIINLAPTVTDETTTIVRLRPPHQQPELAKPNTIEPFTDDLHGVKLEMVYVSKGKFTMGSEKDDSEKPPHEVTVPAFYIGKFQITQAQWKAVMGDKLKPRFKGDDLPMESVSWEDAQEFCKKLAQMTNKAYRLPSEAEWEMACRAGTTTEFAFGDSLSSDQANFNGNYPYGDAKKSDFRKTTTPVGSFDPNAFGLFDMHGNVWEWCEDVWHGDYKKAPTDGSAWLSGGDSTYRVLRGGSLVVSGYYCRSAYRVVNRPGYRIDIVGFRVVVSART